MDGGEGLPLEHFTLFSISCILYIMYTDFGTRKFGDHLLETDVSRNAFTGRDREF